MTQNTGIAVLRTPDERFENLPGYEFDPHYLVLDGLRMHYVDAGDANAPCILLLHGEPTWSFLYRTMIPILMDRGFRCVAPDLIGFGRSDKPTAREAYSYQSHLDWLTGFIDGMDLWSAHLFCQDWGGLLSLRLAGDDPSRFASIAAANTFLPTGDYAPPKAFLQWRQYSQDVAEFDCGRIVAGTCVRPVDDTVQAAYNAPFPDETFQAGARAFPMLVPTEANAPGAAGNRSAWNGLCQFQRPFLTCFSDSDPIMSGVDLVFQAKVPGALGQPHFTVREGGHFLQEDAGDELAPRYADWLDTIAWLPGE